MAAVPENLTAEQRALRERVAQFAQGELAALEQTLPAEPLSPVPAALRREVAARARAAGIHGLLQPKELGGGGAGAVERVIAVETLAQCNLRLARHALGPDPGVLATAGGPLRERYLRPLLAGEKRSALAITEPRGGQQPTVAQREAGQLRINGRKSYVTGGAEADFFVVAVAVAGAPGEPPARALCVIDRETPGMRIERAFRSADGSGHVQLVLDDVCVPQDQLLAPAMAGGESVRSGLTPLRLHAAARACGGARWAIERVTARVREPHRDGIPLGQREGVRLRLADMAIALYAARSALYRSARLLDAGNDARHELMLTKILCTENAVQVVDRAVLLAGGEALIEGDPLARMQRELHALLIAEGASDVLRQSLAKGMVERGFRDF